MLAIFKREFRAFFNNVLGWLFVAVNFGFLSLYFFASNLFQGNSNVGYIYSYVIYMFIILIPVLTMKILAQDRRDKTDQLIFTAPVSLFGVIMGKYLALVAVFAIPSGLSAFFPIIARQYGEVSMPEAYTGLLGYFLYGCAAIAVGMFISSLTDNTIVSAVLSVIVLFLVYIMTWFENILSNVPVLNKVTKALNFNSRVMEFSTGFLNFEAILYFVSVAAIFIFLTINFIKKRRWTFTRKTIAKGISNVILIVLVVGLVVTGNWGFSKLPEKYRSVDVTSQKIFQLTEDTKNLLNSTDKNITFYVYAKETSVGEDLKKSLRYYKEFKNISVEYIDPATNPGFAAKYDQTDMGASSIVVTCGDKFKVVDSSSFYYYDSNSYYGYSQPTGYDVEGQLTSAVSFVISDDNPVIYNIKGNDELPLGAGFKSMISKQNMEVKDLDLIKVDEIPEDADAIMIIAPATDINEDELSVLRNYVARGGKIYICLGYTEKELTNIYDLMADFSLDVTNGVIMETDRNNYYQEQDYLIPVVASTISAGSSIGDTIFAVQPLGITNANTIPEASLGDAEGSEEEENANETELSATVNVIATSSEGAVLKTDVVNATTTDKEEGDKEGVFILGATSELGQAKMVAFASAFMTDDSVDAVVSGNNAKLFGNVMNYMVEREETVSIPAKSISSPMLTVPNADLIAIGILFIFVFPVALVVIGIIIWVKRKKK